MQLITWHVLSHGDSNSWEKNYDLRYQNGAMVSDSFADRKTKSCR